MNWNEDVPSDNLTKYPGKPRHLWTCRGFMWIAIFAVISLWAGMALAQDRDNQGRIVINGMGGGSFQWGYNEAERYWRAGEPIRLEGRYVSAGTFLLWSVERLPGSCIALDALFGFHEPQHMGAAIIGCAPFGMDHPDRDAALETITRPYNAALTAWFMRDIAGDQAECGFTNLRGHQMGAFGYEVCDDQD